MATPEDQARFEQAQSSYTFGRPVRAVAESLGIPTTSDDALRMAAGPRASLAAWALGSKERLSGPSAQADEPTLTTPTVPEAAANAPTAGNFPATGQIPLQTDEYLTGAQRAAQARVPADYAPLISDGPQLSGDAWRQANGFPTQAELQSKIDAFAAQEGLSDARGYPFIQPAESPVRQGLVGPRTHQDMLDSPIFGDAYRASLARGESPLPIEMPPDVVRPESAAMSDTEKMGKPGVIVTPEEADRLIAADDARIAAREAASIPRATRTANLLRGAANDFLSAVPVADAIVTPALAAGALAGLEVQDSTPAGVLRDTAFRILQKPLDMPQVGQSADYLRQNPAITRQLYQEGVLSTDAFMTLMDQAMATQPSLEPMRQAMSRIGG